MRFSKWFLVIIFASMAYAADENQSHDQFWGEQLLKPTEAMPASIKTWAKAISKQTTDTVNRQFVTASEKESRRVFIFVSQSLAMGQIRFAIAESAKYKDCIVVFYGVKKDQTIMQFSHWLHQLAKEVDGKPKAIIDPLLFDKYHVNAVPTMVLATKTKNETIKLSGILDVETLLDGDNNESALGPVKPIIEKHFIALIKEKIKAYPWQQWKAKARQQFWLKQHFITLSPAQIDSKRYVSAKVQVTKDIASPTGQVVAHKGDVINQLSLVPMSRSYIVINPRRERELNWVKRYVSSLSAKPMIMLANLPSDFSWQRHHDLQHSLGLPTYLLTAPVKQRFQIRVTPSVIQAEGDHFIVTEVALDED